MRGSDQPAPKGVPGKFPRGDVNFSLELRDNDMDRSLETCGSVLEHHPMIDGLELISQEDIENPVREIEHNTKVIQALREKWKGERNLKYAAGIYSTTVPDLQPFPDIMHLRSDEEAIGHSTRQKSWPFRKMGFSAFLSGFPAVRLFEVEDFVQNKRDRAHHGRPHPEGGRKDGDLPGDLVQGPAVHGLPDHVE